MLIAFSVTPEDIRGAMRRDPYNCPVARAIQRRFYYSRIPYEWITYVSVSTKEITLSGYFARIRTPPKLRSQLARYDGQRSLAHEGFIRYKPMQPFTFTLDVPDSIALLLTPPLALPPAPEAPK